METANRALVQQYFDALNSHQMEALQALVDSGFVDHAPLPGQKPGRDGWFEARLEAFWTAFSDLVYAVNDLIAENDLVVVRGSAAGTHSGVFLGIAATGRPVQWTYTQMFRIREGRLAEGWTDFDLLGILNQIEAGQKT
jgi:steroid delta-isomerase-like uncharacterized protein